MNEDLDISQVGSIDGTMIRGGTSRGLFLHVDDVPTDETIREELVLELLGSPDPLQLNGVGGGKSHLSKVMIVGPSDRDDADVNYTFGQVSIREASVDWSRNNGNVSSAVGPYALFKGLVSPTEPETELTLYNTNTDTYVDQRIPIENGEPAIYGDYKIDGVPGTGAKIETTFREPGGAVTGDLLPMGEPVTTFDVDGREIEASVVDSGTLGVAFRAADFGLTGTELPDQLAANDEVLETIETVRNQIRAELGLENAQRSNPSAAIVSEPQSYDCSVDETVDADDIDITARYISLQPHHAASLTGSMSLSTSTRIPGTIPNEVVRSAEEPTVRIGHPKGTITLDADITRGDTPHVNGVTFRRTMCPVFDGQVYYRYLGALEALR
jgi:2-methylaconitate cis-trans-isomerase PrpF